MRAQNSKNGADDKQFGVLHRYIRKVANKAKTNHDLALSLWKTRNIDARLLATLIINPNSCRSKRWKQCRFNLMCSVRCSYR